MQEQIHILKTLILGDPVGGWPSMMCVILLLGGIQLLCIGILGQYLAKTYLETKHRPVYIIKETERNVLSDLSDKTDRELGTINKQKTEKTCH